MTEFLLIHGSCHGAWCWQDTLAALAARGQRARAIDLPCRGVDSTPAAQATLDLFAEAILDAIDTPVTLVGHSFGGFPITAAAQKAPEKIARLIYVCAYLPRPGQSLAAMRKSWPDQPLRGCFTLSEDGTAFGFRPEILRDRFYHDCPDDAFNRARQMLCPEPVAPQETALPSTTRAARLPRHYIRCTEDRAIPPAFQSAMVADWPPGTVTDLPSGHSPFFAMPERLAQRLIAASA